jgi:drug/metabolite transporter (DMT)-like permease
MVILASLAGVSASFGWAGGSLLAFGPARQLGSFTFTWIQLGACAVIMCTLSGAAGQWARVDWQHWPAFATSALVGILAGNLAMIACLRAGGPRRTELLLSFKAPLVALMAFLWLGEQLSLQDLAGAGLVLAGVFLAIAQDEGRSQVTLPAWKVAGLGVFATLCQGIGFLSLKPALQNGTPVLAASAIRLSLAALMITAMGTAAAQRRSALGHVPLGLALRTLVPGILGYGVSSSLLLFAFTKLEAGLAAALGSLSPVLVLPLLWAFRGERPSRSAAMGAVLAVAGGILIVMS